MKSFRFLGLLLLAMTLAACGRGRTPDDLPTPAQADPLATAVFLTQNAPPEGFRGPLRLPRVDDGLRDLRGWRYVVQLEFNGTFSNTPRTTSASATAEVWFRQLNTARRVLVSTAGELIGKREDDAFEAVRQGPDAFLVRNNLCVTDGPDPQIAADLDAGRLVGGVNSALPDGARATINGEEVWRYAFSPADLTLPSIRIADGGGVTMTGGELWFAPARGAAIRFYLNLDVQNAIIFDRQLPVSGQVIIRYDVYDIGIEPNITVPFGC